MTVQQLRTILSSFPDHLNIEIFYDEKVKDDRLVINIRN